MTASLFANLRRLLSQRPVLAWSLAAAAALPPEWAAFFWKLDMPGQVAAQLAWLPVVVLCQARLWQALGRALQPSLSPARGTGSAALSLAGMQFLFNLRLVPVALLCLAPSLAIIAIIHPETMSGLLLISIPLVALSAIPVLLYAFHRLLSPGLIVWQGQRAAESLNSSPKYLRGTLRACLPLLVVFLVLDTALSNLPEAFNSTTAYLISTFICFPATTLLETCLVASLYTRLAINK